MSTVMHRYCKQYEISINTYIDGEKATQRERTEAAAIVSCNHDDGDRRWHLIKPKRHPHRSCAPVPSFFVVSPGRKRRLDGENDLSTRRPRKILSPKETLDSHRVRVVDDVGRMHMSPITVFVWFLNGWQKIDVELTRVEANFNDEWNPYNS